MAHVSCRMFEMYERGAVELGIAPERLLEGTTLTLEMVRNKRNRAPWSEWTKVCENFEWAVGGPAAMRRWGYRFVEHDYSSGLRRVAGTLLTTTNLYRAAITWLAPILYPHLHFSLSARGSKVRITISVPEPLEGCAAWFRLVEGTLVVVPRLLARPDAVVRGEISERRAVYDITVPSAGRGIRGWRMLGRLATRPSAVMDLLAEVRSDLDEAYRAALASEQEARAVLQSLPDPVAIVSDGRLVETNQAWRSVFAPNQHFDIRRPFLDYFAPEHRQAAQLLLDGVTPPGDLLMLARDQTRVLAVPSLSSRLRYQRNPARAVVVRVVTVQRQQEAILSAAERVTALGAMAASVAHDINNPLGAVLGNLELLTLDLQQLPPSVQRDAALESAHAAMQGTERVAGIAVELVTLSRVQDDAHPASRAEEVIDAMVTLAGNEIRHRAKLVKDYHPTPHVALSHARLSQLVLNLLLHAARSIPPGFALQHTITLHTSTSDDDRVIVEVSDTGPGIEADRIDHFFEPTHAAVAAHGGAPSFGLGLAIAHRIVDAAGGAIDVRSTLGSGTTVRLSLPVGEPWPAAAPPPSAPSPVKKRVLRVLVVDDEPSLRRIICRMLREHEVEVVESGTEALAALERDSARDVVFCDVMMPDLTGLDVHARVLDTDPNLAARFVFITGGAFGADTQATLESLPNSKVYKPFRREDLEQAMERLGS